jgi:hypothetical protein
MSATLAGETQKEAKALAENAGAGAAPPTILNPEPTGKTRSTVSHDGISDFAAAKKPAERAEMAKREDIAKSLESSTRSRPSVTGPAADGRGWAMDADGDRMLALKDSVAAPAGAARPAAPSPAPSTPANRGVNGEAKRAVLTGTSRMATTAPAQSTSASLRAEGQSPAPVAVAMSQNHPVVGGAYFANTLVPYAEKNGQQATLRKNFQSPPSPAVLTQFQLQQNGTEVRITDQDGSVYVGEMLTVTDETSAVGEKDKVVKAKPEEVSFFDSRRTGAAGRGSQSFRATGTNLTLNQNVVISGELVEFPAVAAKQQEQPGFKGSVAEKAKLKAATPAPMHIQGRVQIGEQQEIILNAVPMSK